MGFWRQADRTLYRISIHGGTAVPLCELDEFSGAEWTADGTIVFGRGRQGIWRISADAGDPEPLVRLDEGTAQSAHRPQLLPGGERVLFALATGVNWSNASIVVQSIENDERSVLIERGYDPQYLPTGHVVYARDDTIFAVPFDLSRLQVTGGPVPVIEDVAQTSSSYGTGGQSSAFHHLAHSCTRAVERLHRLVWMDREGKATPVTERRAQYQSVKVSPDGQRLAVSLVESGQENLYFYDIERESFSRLPRDGNNRVPAWSPDGQWVAFMSDRDRDWDLYRTRSDFSGAAERLLRKDGRQYPRSWSPDGESLVFVHEDPSNLNDIWVLSLDGNREARPFLQTPMYDTLPDLSPDG